MKAVHEKLTHIVYKNTLNRGCYFLLLMLLDREHQNVGTDGFRDHNRSKDKDEPETVFAQFFRENKEDLNRNEKCYYIGPPGNFRALFPSTLS